MLADELAEERPRQSLLPTAVGRWAAVHTILTYLPQVS